MPSFSSLGSSPISGDSPSGSGSGLNSMLASVSSMSSALSMSIALAAALQSQSNISAGIGVSVSIQSALQSQSAIGGALAAGTAAVLASQLQSASTLASSLGVAIALSSSLQSVASMVSSLSAGSSIIVMPPACRVYRVPVESRVYQVPADCRFEKPPPIYIMDPSAVLDFETDWTPWLASGEVIVGTPVITVPAGITLSTGPTVSGGKVVYWLSNPVAGQYYAVDCTITTNQGRTDSRSIQIRCRTRSAASFYFKDPSSVLDYAFDWADWLPAGDAISGLPVITVPMGLDLAIGPVSNGSQVVYWLSTGTPGVDYEVKCTIATIEGRTDSRSIKIRCRIL